MSPEVLSPLALFVMVTAIVWIAHLTKRREYEHRTELMRNLIDKFSSGEAFAKTMDTAEGRRLVDALSLGKKDDSTSKVGLFTGGAVLTCLGIGFFVLSRLQSKVFEIPGVVVASVGAALLISSYVAWRAEEKAIREVEKVVANGARSDRGADDTRLP